MLAQHGTRNTTQIALLTRRSHKSGGFRNSLSKLRSAGLIDGRGEVTITDAGTEALGSWEPLPQQGPDLIHWWGTQLGKAERLVLDYLAVHPGRAVPVDELAQQTGYSPTSGGIPQQPVAPALPWTGLRTWGTANLQPARRLIKRLVSVAPLDSVDAAGAAVTV